jgi:hypothetical protein
MICAHIVFAQDTNKIKKIVLDFKTKTFADTSLNNLKTIKKGDYYQLEINDINMNLFNVSLEKKDSAITSNVSIPTFETIGIDAINQIIKNLNTSTNSTIQLAKENINQTITDLNKFKPLLGRSNTNTKKIEIALQKKQILDSISSNMDSLKNITIKTRPTISSIDTLLMNMNLQSIAYLISPTDLTSQYLEDHKIRFDTIIYQIQNFKNQLNKIKRNLCEFKDNYENYIVKSHIIDSLVNNDPQIKKENDSFLSQIIEINTTIDKALKKIDPEKISQFMNAIIHLENNSIRKFQSLEMPFTEDIGELKISIDPKNKEFGLPSYTTTLKFPINKKVYAGVGTSFYYALFKNDRFSIRDSLSTEISKTDSTSIDSISHFRIVNEKLKKGEIGIAALLHVGCKPFNNINIGLDFTIGPAITIEAKPKARLAIGIGASYGNENNMLSLDFLWMGGYVDRLSNVYNENEIYSIKPDQITISKLDYKVGIAIGYIYKF